MYVPYMCTFESKYIRLCSRQFSLRAKQFSRGIVFDEDDLLMESTNNNHIQQLDKLKDIVCGIFLFIYNP